MNFFKRLFCKHDYKTRYTAMIHAGMGKMLNRQCDKCGKRRVEFI